jgi:hypothetical protein
MCSNLLPFLIPLFYLLPANFMYSFLIASAAEFTLNIITNMNFGFHTLLLKRQKVKSKVISVS